MDQHITTIIKRDGRTTPFSVGKIELAIVKANNETHEFDFKEARRLSEIVRDILEKVVGVRKEPVTVEQVQDTVEQVLMAGGHFKTAKAYILYRAEHAKIRKAETALGVKNDLQLSINQLKVIERRYLVHDFHGKATETPGQMFRRVAHTLASVEKTASKKKKWGEVFYEVMTKFEFLPGGRTLNNAGTPQNQLANCFVIPVEDTMEGIFDAVKWTALVHQNGGGTGFSFSKLRPRGDIVKKSSGGFSTGPVSFIKVFDIATRQVMQGGKQRGANMGILAVNHPDILEFINCKTEEGEISNFNISVGATDTFMKAVERDKEFALVNPRTNKAVSNISARLLMDQIVSLAWRTGDPGMIYWDAINRDNPLLDSVGPIYATNPCVTSDARIPTSQGLLSFEDLHRKYQKENSMNVSYDARVLERDGLERGRITATYDQGEKEVYKVTTRMGYTVTATADHKIRTDKGWIPVKELTKDDNILLQSDEGLFSREENFPSLVPKSENLPTHWSQHLGQVLGWLVGDGWLRDGDKNCRVGWTFGNNDRKAEGEFQKILSGWYGSSIAPVKRTSTTSHLSFHGKEFVAFFRELGVNPVKADEKRVPFSVFTAPKEAIVGFLQGLFSADGTVAYDKQHGTGYIRLTSKSRELLRDVQILLVNFGILSSLFDRSRVSRTNMFPYTKTNGEKVSYTTDGLLWELNISKTNTRIFCEKIGFLFGKHEERMKNICAMKLHMTEYVDQVFSIEKIAKQRVYDLTESVSHSFIANGIVVSNCGEQPLHPFDSCNLGSINLSAFVRETANSKDKTKKPELDWDRLGFVTRSAVRMLDNVIDACKYPLPQITKTVQENRGIGLGVMGWADLLLHMGIPYNSDEGVKLAEKVMKFVQGQSWISSEQLAKEKGAFPKWKESWFAKGYDPETHKYSHKNNPRKLRNVAITTIAPTGTISMAAECSSGIEPVFALSYNKNVVDSAGLMYVNAYFEKALRNEVGSNGKFNEIVAKVAETGSVHNLDDVSNEIKKTFVTAHDISWEWHVKMQAAFQKYTDNAVSKTINFPSNATVDEVRGAYIMAWKLGCKGITVYRDKSKGMQVLSLSNGTHDSDKKESKTKQLMQSQIRVTPLADRTDFASIVRQEIQKGDTIDIPQEEEEKCPECGMTMNNQEGCNLCPSCGYSKCKL